MDEEIFTSGLDPLTSWDASQYQYYPSKIRPETREELKAALPQLFSQAPEAKSARRLLDVLLFPPLPDTRGQTNDPVVTCYMVAHLDGRKYSKSYSSGGRLAALLDLIGQPYDPLTWDYQQGQARTVHVYWSNEIRAIVAAARQQAGQPGTRVYFDSGKRIGRGRSRAEMQSLAELNRAANARCSPGDPAWKTLELLNAQSAVVQDTLWKQNMPAVDEAVQRMPENTEKERISKSYTQDLLMRLPESKVLRYKAVGGTTRVYADGSSLVQLPREIRKIAHKGCYEIDLSSAQIAVACVVLPQMLGTQLPEKHQVVLAEVAAQLKSGRSYWAMLLEDLGIPEAFKPELKVAGCSTLFGKCLRNVVADIREALHPRGTTKGAARESGRPYMTRVAAVKACRGYESHQWVAAFDAACKAFMGKAAQEGGAQDAFGRWESIIESEVRNQRGRDDWGHRKRSCLAAVMQSYEQKIMHAAIEEVSRINSKRPEMHIIAWLHDGLTISASQRKEAYASRIASSLTKRANEMGIPTRGEIKEIS